MHTYLPRKARRFVAAVALITAGIVGLNVAQAPRAEAWLPPSVKIAGCACNGSASSTSAASGSTVTVTVKNVENNSPGTLTSTPALTWSKTTLKYNETATATATVPAGTGTYTVNVTLTWYDSHQRVLDRRSASASVHYAPCVTPTTTPPTTIPPTTVPPTTLPPTTLPASTTTVPAPTTTTTVATTSTTAASTTTTTAVATTTTRATAPTPTAPSTVPTVAVGNAAVTTLPVTGSEIVPLTLIALLLIGGGAGLLYVRRRTPGN